MIGLARSTYVFDGVPDVPGGGDLELRFEDGRRIVLTTASDGESVAAEERALRLSPTFVLDGGSKCEWIRRDLSMEEPYIGLCNEPLRSVDAVVEQSPEINHHAIAGWVLHFGDRVLSYVNEGDEGRLGVESPGAEPPRTTLEDVGGVETAA